MEIIRVRRLINEVNKEGGRDIGAPYLRNLLDKMRKEDAKGAIYIIFN